MYKTRSSKCARCRNHSNKSSAMKGRRRACRLKTCPCKECKSIITQLRKVGKLETMATRRREGEKLSRSQQVHRPEGYRNPVTNSRDESAVLKCRQETGDDTKERASSIRTQEDPPHQKSPTNAHAPIRHETERIMVPDPSSTTDTEVFEKNFEQSVTNVNAHAPYKNESERYLNILYRLYPHQDRRLLQLILKGCNNDVVHAIESILPTQIHTGLEWVPVGYQMCTCSHGRICAHHRGYNHGCACVHGRVYSHGCMCDQARVCCNSHASLCNPCCVSNQGYYGCHRDVDYNSGYQMSVCSEYATPCTCIESSYKDTECVKNNVSDVTANHRTSLSGNPDSVIAPVESGCTPMNVIR